jgi:hypothetical protein
MRQKYDLRLRNIDHDRDIRTVEWRIGSTHDSGARGPGFELHPDPDGIFGNSHLPSFRQRT